MPFDNTQTDLRREFIRYLREEGPKHKRIEGFLCQEDGYCALGLFGKMLGLGLEDSPISVYDEFDRIFEGVTSHQEVYKRNDRHHYSFAATAQWLESLLDV
jgi:hypothetical protein